MIVLLVFIFVLVFVLVSVMCVLVSIYGFNLSFVVMCNALFLSVLFYSN